MPASRPARNRLQTHTVGYPRIGPNRELKRATEAYWAGRTDRAGLEAAAREIRRANWMAQRDAGIDLVAVNDFSFYDQVLDTIALVGAMPPRFDWAGGEVDLDTYFTLARGREGATPLALRKWLDTNYHYLVPEFQRSTRFSLGTSKPFDEVAEARALGLTPQPILLGPVSFLLLGEAKDGVDPLTDLLDPLLDVYADVVRRLAEAGAPWIAFEEPALVLDRTPADLAAVRHAYERLAPARGASQILVQTLPGRVDEAYETLVDLPVQGIGLDFTRGRSTHLALLRQHGFPADRVLAVGLVDGRNVWATDPVEALQVLDDLSSRVAPDQLRLGPSCSLQHVPYDVERETDLPDDLRPRLAFARQKLDEVVAIARAFGDNHTAQPAVRTDAERRQDQHGAVTDAGDHRRPTPRSERAERQTAALGLPPLPTTTIGSFPQSKEIRRQRKRFLDGDLSQRDYESFLEEEIRRVVRLQEDLGFDVLVHGEFERTDMVEYFAERLAGFATTRAGWVQSYGTRYVRPPIIWADVSRPEPMTVRWAAYAQSLTDRPVKGMLTGPVTMLQWSFARDDQPRETTCRQIARALRAEVVDLEAAGIRVIQVDEPALREGLPLRAADRPDYLRWAADCFRVTTGGVRDETQVHTHMCYVDFADIAEAIEALDADVISLEAARSGMAFLPAVASIVRATQIGPGVYDVHSPRVPSQEEVEHLLRRALASVPASQLWANPDCGLKTRDVPEVLAALGNLTRAATRVRADVRERAGVTGD